MAIKFCNCKQLFTIYMLLMNKPKSAQKSKTVIYQERSCKFLTIGFLRPTDLYINRYVQFQ